MENKDFIRYGESLQHGLYSTDFFNEEDFRRLDAYRRENLEADKLRRLEELDRKYGLWNRGLDDNK